MSEFYLTFGIRYAQQPHPTFLAAHPNGWVVIEAGDLTEARETAFNVFGQSWAFIYSDEHFDRSLHRMGELGRIRDGHLLGGEQS